MAKVNLPNLKTFDAKSMGKILADIKRGIENWDLDNGWEAASGSKTHRLGIAPKFVQIQVSNDVKGDSYSTIHPDTVTSTVITYTTAFAYVRILAEK